MKKLFTLGLLLVAIVLGGFVGCSKDTPTETPTPKTSPLSVTSITCGAIDSAMTGSVVDSLQYVTAISLKNSGNGTATSVQIKVGFLFEGETAYTFVNGWVPWESNIAAGATSTRADTSWSKLHMVAVALDSIKWVTQQ
ncbi:hypothetical protein HY768_11100 [candidate division TA06 bacterium]|uniref:CARDB domain-containing protein n=1 Tax=candidate division TA06 bacterium TaxID=2250710 RepID=A0A933MLF9_UNCT6|nr:hypothetical protein [candidate division TA06 bacterium]